MTLLLEDALMPNWCRRWRTIQCSLMWTAADIAHGCNSVRQRARALKLCDYVETEAGFVPI